MLYETKFIHFYCHIQLLLIYLFDSIQIIKINQLSKTTRRKYSITTWNFLCLFETRHKRNKHEHLDKLTSNRYKKKQNENSWQNNNIISSKQINNTNKNNYVNCEFIKVLSKSGFTLLQVLPYFTIWTKKRYKLFKPM